MEKILNMEKTLEPSWLPIEIAFQDQFKCGSNVNRRELRESVLWKFEQSNSTWFRAQIQRLQFKSQTQY
jgi:hypothetical protein